MKLIPLTRGLSAKVDDRDFARLNTRKWFALNGGSGNYYAAYSENYKKADGKKTNRTILMHRVLMQPSDGLVVDHKNGDSLDNRSRNLRTCSHAQNTANRRKKKAGVSKYKGVVWNNRKGVWQVQFKRGAFRLTRGYFKSEKEAARLWNQLARKYHGEFACLNRL